MSQHEWPNRVRISGGRATHSACPAPGLPDGVTACGYTVGPDDHPLDDTATVTCNACIREMNR